MALRRLRFLRAFRGLHVRAQVDAKYPEQPSLPIKGTCARAVKVSFASRDASCNSSKKDIIMNVSLSRNPQPCGPSTLLLDLSSFTQVTPRHIHRLYRGEILAIRFSTLYGAEHCGRIAEAVETLYSGETYSGSAADIRILGLPVFEIQGDAERCREYHERAMKEQRALRALVAPRTLPIDELRVWFDEIWPWGSMLARFVDLQAANCGLNRIVLPGTELLPHNDRTDHDLKGNPLAATLLTQLAGNAYVAVGAGGALQIWRQTVEPGAEFDTLRLRDTYGIDRNLIPPPDLVIEPKVGDLILFDATRIHAVTPQLSGSRITCSCFIGYCGEKRPLIFYS
jgi:hypothetical protein